jgi:hypothetical protein
MRTTVEVNVEVEVAPAKRGGVETRTPTRTKF